MPSEINIYAACDRAIKTMDRESLRAFGQLKGAKWDEINVIRTVLTLYRKQAKKAELHYYEVATEAYILGLMECGIGPVKAHRMAEQAITDDWVRELLETEDPVTLYIFDNEVERKAQRLAEALAAVGSGRGSIENSRDLLIDRALRDWSRMLGQYAINMTDEAEMDAYVDAGLDEAMWLTAKDERVCRECRELDGQVFPIHVFPPKPHRGCRCRKKPVRK